MTIKGLFKSIARARADRLSGREIKDIDANNVAKVLANARAIAAAYGDVLGGEETSLIRDIETLPYSKEQIKLALEVLLQATSDLSTKEHLKVAYLGLSSFQRISPAELQAVEAWERMAAKAGNTSDADLKDMTSVLSQTGPTFLNFQQRTAAEMSVLRQELQTKGLW